MPPKIPRQRKAYKDLNKRLNKYVLLVEDLFEQYNLQLANAAVQSGHADGVFSFSKHPALKARVDKIFDNWRQDFSAIVYRGTSEEWKNSNAMQDMLADGMMKWYWGTTHGKRQRKYYMANNDALKAFQTRVSGGMNLSKRVWRLSNTYKAAIEDILSLGIERGTSAVTLSKRLSKYLNDFPSMRAAYGKKYGRASKAKDCEYQSIRLARSEINMAYRTAEQKRWQQLDFIVGYEIRLSAVHHERMPHGDICDILAGRYPKSFIWTGWHPNDLCYVTPIMKTEDEFFSDSETSVNEVTDVPEAFKEWVRNNEDRILAARERGTEAYFLRDNKELVDGILSGKNTANVQLDPVQHQIDALMPSITKLKKEASDWGLNTYIVDSPLEKRDVEGVKNGIAELTSRIKQTERERAYFIKDAREAIKEAKKHYIVTGPLEDAVFALTSDGEWGKRNWAMNRRDYLTRLNTINGLIADAMQGLVTKGNTYAETKAHREIMALTSMEELERYVVDNGIVSKFELQGTTFGIAREICATWAQYKSMWNLPPIRLGMKRLARSAFAHACGGYMEISSSFFGKLIAATKIDEAYVVNVSEWKTNKELRLATRRRENSILLDAIEIAKRNGDRETWRILNKKKTGVDAEINEIETLLNQGHTRHNVFLSSNSLVRNMAQHEFGHTVDDVLLGSFNQRTFKSDQLTASEVLEMSEQWSDLYDKYKDNCGWLSTYGKTLKGEFLAESMVLYVEQGGAGLPYDVKKWFDRLHRLASRKTP